MKPFVPSDRDVGEFTFRAVLLGLVMCIVLGSANAYLGLKAGMTIAATYPAAVIGMAMIRLMRGTILEENIARTVGSIGESVAAGAIFTLPAFVISGIWPRFFTAGHYLTGALIMATGGTLGIMYVTLLRRVMVEDADLPYPESVAASQIHKAGQGGGGTRFLFGAMGVGALVQILNQVGAYATSWSRFVSFRETPVLMSGAGKGLTAKGGFLLGSPGISPAYMGVGYIIGPRLGALNFAGGVLAWGLLVPLATTFLGPALLPAGADAQAWEGLALAVWKNIVRPIAIGGMLVGAGYTLFRMRGNLAAGLRRSFGDIRRAAAGEHVIDRVNRDIPFSWLPAGMLFAALTTFLLATVLFKAGFAIALTAAVMVVLLGFIFAAVSGYLVGLLGSSNDPISGLTLTALMITALVMVLLGGRGNPGVAAVLCVAAVICVCSGVGGEMLQDLKVGWILGGTPWKMQVGDMMGVVLAASLLFVPLMFLHVGDIRQAVGAEFRRLEAAGVQVVKYAGTQAGLQGEHSLAAVRQMLPDDQKEVLGVDAGFGSRKLAAPQATLMAMVSRGVVEGRMQWALIVAGMLLGVGFILMQVKSPMLVSVGMYLPLETSFAIFLGSLVRALSDRLAARRGLNEAQQLRVGNAGILVASGLIAGEALVGLLFAALAFWEVDFAFIKHGAPFSVALMVLAAVGLILAYAPMRNAGRPDEPAPPSAIM